VKHATAMLLLALLAACSPEMSTTPTRGHYSAVVTDFDSSKPLQGAMVIGIFGYEAANLEHSTFICTGLEVGVTDAAGHVAFARNELPVQSFVYKEGYAVTGSAGIEARYLIGKKDELPPTSFRTLRDDSPAARRFRLELGKYIERACPTWKTQSSGPIWKIEWSMLKPLREALAREAIQSTTSDEERLGVVKLCQDLAAEGDDGGRVPDMGDRFVFTGLEATRLRSSLPECLDRELLLLSMRRPLENVAWAKSVPPEELLERAIVDDPNAYVRYAHRTIMQSCTGGVFAPGHDDSDRLACCVYMGGDLFLQQRSADLVDRVKKKGLQFEVKKNGVCVRHADVEAVQHLALEVN
jgi:hypothetical protein